MANTLITVVGYPETFSFITRQKLPEFKYGCEVRNSIVKKKMKEFKVYSPCHSYDDYVVGIVDKKYRQEFWHLES